jgi:predicted Na+-dependent transporter
MTEILQIIFKESLIIFIVSSMILIGLNFTVSRIIKPLKNVKLVVLSLFVNFILVPMLVYGIIGVVPLNEGERIAMLLLQLSLAVLNTNHLISMIGYPLLAILLLLVGVIAVGYYLSWRKRKTNTCSICTGSRIAKCLGSTAGWNLKF